MKTINSLTTFPQALIDKDKELPESSRMCKVIFHTLRFLEPYWILVAALESSIYF